MKGHLPSAWLSQKALLRKLAQYLLVPKLHFKVTLPSQIFKPLRH
jgi:hypothetical protein